MINQVLKVEKYKKEMLKKKLKMEHIFSSLIPIFSLIVIGYLLKKISFPSHDFWPMADKLTYYILMPALLILRYQKLKLIQVA